VRIKVPDAARSFAALIALAASLAAGSACAQGYPGKPVRIVVPFAAGGAVDELARIIAARLGDSFGQPVIIENHAGVGGNLGTEIVAKAPPDGLTILQTTNGHAISPALYRKLAFDPVKDFVPVTQLVASTLVLVASPGTEIKSMGELVALARSQPGKLNYGSSGVGNPLHLTMEMIKLAAGIAIEPIPYRSDAQINAALMAGDVQVAVVPLATSLPLIMAGRLRALAVTGTARSAALPDAPTISQAGLAGFASSSWQGFFVPARTPREIVERIQAATANVLAAAEVRDRLKAFSYEPVGSTPAEFDAFFKSELAKFAGVVRDAHIPPQD
jgi:tripartite-type tricarboxylate transporter receptor subunit TctC